MPGDNLQSAVALATANALFNQRQPDMDTGDILDIMAVSPDDRVGMVGALRPVDSAAEEAGRGVGNF